MSIEEKVSAALAKVSADGIPGVSYTRGTLTLTYDCAAYDARVSADMAALATVCAVGASRVVEQTARIAQGSPVSAPVLAQVVSVSVRSLGDPTPKK